VLVMNIGMGMDLVVLLLWVMFGWQCSVGLN
jgi:hypothetical protein